MPKLVRGYLPSDPKLIKARDCLRCDRTFLSSGPHNRICQDCRSLAEHHPTPEPTYGTMRHWREWVVSP
jgi:hypothetical protein